MGIYSTRRVSRSSALAAVAERLPLATNNALRCGMEMLSEYMEEDEDLEEIHETRSDRIAAIMGLLSADSFLLHVPSREYGNKLDEVLGDILDLLFKEETLNNYIVGEKGERF